MLRIITDSSSDFSLEEAQEKGCELIPLKVIEDEVTYRDRFDLTVEELYKKMIDEKKMIKTSQPSPTDFLQVFEDVKEKGDEALCLILSEKLSGTYQSAMIAKEMAEGARIEVLDTHQVTIPQKLLVLEALKMRDRGCSLDEITEQIKALMSKVKVLAVIDTLEYLVKGGRLSKAAGFAGTVIDLKPIVTVEDGKVAVAAKARGKKKALEKLWSKIENEIDTKMPMILVYSGDRGYAELLKAFLNEKGICVEKMDAIGCAIGVHVGPGACGLAYFKK